MKFTSGFLKVAFVWMVILMQRLDAGHVPKKVAVVPCRPRELTALTRSLVQASLTSFDEANGRHLGTWLPGFPELEVNGNSTLNGSSVACSLRFMDLGLAKILEDQRSNLNPQDVSLHKKLKDTISRVHMLAACLKETLGGECSPNPAPPEMPKHTFERKQWSHTLLKTARDYLNWLERKLAVQITKVKGKKRIVAEARRYPYFEGSGHLL